MAVKLHSRLAAGVVFVTVVSLAGAAPSFLPAGGGDGLVIRYALLDQAAQTEKPLDARSLYEIASHTGGLNAAARRSLYENLSYDGDMVKLKADNTAREAPSEYLRTTGIPFFRSSLCSVERYLAAALYYSHGELPSYVIYADSRTVALVNEMLTSFPGVKERSHLVNLDEDPEDSVRMKAFAHLNLNPVNAASVRRALADTVYLSNRTGRLLMGLDAKFISEPTEILRKMESLKVGQATYMVDSVIPTYVMRTYVGPQCPGFLGDFFFLNRGVHWSIADLGERLTWYARQPISTERMIPHCLACEELSAGLHAIDQFAVMLTLADTVQPAGSQGCFALEQRHAFHNSMSVPHSLLSQRGIEVVHDKTADTGQCDPVPGTALLGMVATGNTHNAASRNFLSDWLPSMSGYGIGRKSSLMRKL